MIRPLLTSANRCRRNVVPAIPCVLSLREAFDGKTIRLPGVSAVSGRHVSNALSTVNARSETPRRSLASVIERKIFHLWTTLSSGQDLAFAWLATMASVSVRRPKGAVGRFSVMFLAFSGKERVHGESFPLQIT